MAPRKVGGESADPRERTSVTDGEPRDRRTPQGSIAIVGGFRGTSGVTLEVSVAVEFLVAAAAAIARFQPIRIRFRNPTDTLWPIFLV
eukprot:scaffold7381_cov310-Pinguiococcus_pyrenoidosus.AAC.57